MVVDFPLPLLPFGKIVERNLDYLLENMPVYPAPARDIPEVTAQMPTLSVSSQQGKTAASRELTLLQAEIPAEFAENTTSAFFVCSGSCYEAAILYPNGSGPVASAWIPADYAGSISVIYGNESSYCISDAALN